MSIFGAVKCNISRASRGLRPLGPHQGPALDPLGGLKRPPAARGNDLTVIAYHASGTIIPTQTYPSPSTNSYTQSKALQYPTNFSSTFGAVGQGSLSFCWQFSDGTVQYFHFNVLPFGLSPAPQVFTKLMRQLIKYWRAKAIRVVFYIDDGIGRAGTFENAVIISQQMKSDLAGCGFILNKSLFGRLHSNYLGWVIF